MPTEFSAATRKSYEVPFVRPGIKAYVAPVTPSRYGIQLPLDVALY
ncbi:unannotated protein [freshwater metagenome]|uniref:Unannotated protein n=1 Tax=freshwater metagenome TaxID=449393 RepID=A0A6J6U0K2_9ZZZZ